MSRRGLDGVAYGVQTGSDGARRRELDRPDGVPDGSHVIGHVIFECHVTRLGWYGVILIPTLLSQR
jgi:hypothetical protein